MKSLDPGKPGVFKKANINMNRCKKKGWKQLYLPKRRLLLGLPPKKGITLKILSKLENPKAQKLLNKMQRDLMRNGLILNTIVEDLKELRPYAVEENNPLLAKVIRLTYEHIESYQTFDIPIPEDEPVEGFEEETGAPEENDATESLDYLLSLMTEADNKMNALELREYSTALTTYAEEN